MKTGNRINSVWNARSKNCVIHPTTTIITEKVNFWNAAVAYADAASYESEDYEWMRREVLNGAWAATGWPQDQFRPKRTAIENLVIAGALIAAEIDRLQHFKCKVAHYPDLP